MATFLPDGDASMMLNNCLVVYKGQLVYVQGVARQTMVIHDVETGEKVTVPADFDHIKAPNNGRLGYVNGVRTHYVNRFAARVYRLGFSSSNLKGAAKHHGLGNSQYSLQGERLEAVRQTYNNEFLSFEEVYAKLKAAPRSKALAYDRSWLLYNKYNDEPMSVYYRDQKVGTVDRPDEGKIKWVNDALKKLNTVRHRPALNWG